MINDVSALTYDDRSAGVVAAAGVPVVLMHHKGAPELILVDPGFGFGKNVGHNLEIMNGLALFHSLGCPMVVGASRKRTIGALSGAAPADQRLGGSIAFAL